MAWFETILFDRDNNLGKTKTNGLNQIFIDQGALKMFERACFGYFLNLRDMRFNVVLVHSFVLRQFIRGDMRTGYD